MTKEYIDIVKAPKHGYGRNLNPCLDCRIFIFKKAGEYMRQSGASFIVTGEVLGERPMSQRMDAMRIIEKESGLTGLIVRPLCAKLMEPTVLEKEGLVDREKLLNIQGRSRKPQIQLASELDIHDYPCPAGGCLLTDKGFADRMRDLMKHNPDFTVHDIKFLKIGRHFRLGAGAKLIVGRNEEENNTLSELANVNDLSFWPINRKGPLGIGRGVFDKSLIDIASCIIVKYSDRQQTNNQVEIGYRRNFATSSGSIITCPAEEDLLDRLRI